MTRLNKLKETLEKRGFKDVEIFKDERGYHASFETEKGNYSVGDLMKDDKGQLLHMGFEQLENNVMAII